MNPTNFIPTVAAEDHSQYDCFSCAISSHGTELFEKDEEDMEHRYDVVYGRNGPISVTLLTSKLEDVPSLMNKPRLFFIQVLNNIFFGNDHFNSADAKLICYSNYNII